MGTGKTYITIGILGILSQLSLVSRVLIVCPLSIMSVWEQEITRFADFPFSITLLRGTMAKKLEQLASVPRTGLQIVVTNYETMWRAEDALQSFPNEPSFFGRS